MKISNLIKIKQRKLGGNGLSHTFVLFSKHGTHVQMVYCSLYYVFVYGDIYHVSVFIYKKHAEDMSSFSDDVSVVLFESQSSRSNLIVYLYDFPYAISYIKYQEYQSDYLD